MDSHLIGWFNYMTTVDVKTVSLLLRNYSHHSLHHCRLLHSDGNFDSFYFCFVSTDLNSLKIPAFCFQNVILRLINYFEIAYSPKNYEDHSFIHLSIYENHLCSIGRHRFLNFPFY